MKGLRDGLGAKASMIIADKSYEVSDPTIHSQIVALMDRAPISSLRGRPRRERRGIRKVAELGWKPVYLLGNVSTSVATVLKPAGLENAKGIISTAYLKDPPIPLERRSGYQGRAAFMDKYFPDGDKTNNNMSTAMHTAQTMVQVLKQCGDDLTRENVMKQAASLKNFASDVLLPGVKINTSANDFFPIEQMQLMKFDGESWELFGDIIAGEVGH